jgi:hypothetical protein
MDHEQGDGFVIVSMSGHGNEARERTKAPLPEVVHPDVVRDPAALSGEPTCTDLAALLTPIGANPLEATTVEDLIDAAVQAGTMVVVDWKGVDTGDTGALLQLACAQLGLRAPGPVPNEETQLGEGLARLDKWLEPVGVRLIDIQDGSSDTLVVPVLAADHETFAGRTIEGYRVRSMERLAAEEA